MEKKQKIKYLAEILALVFVFFVCVTPVLASEITADNIIKYVNQSREQQGLAALTANAKLQAVAQDKLIDMIKNRYFSHTSPSGINPWHWFTKNGYDYQYAGENLAINFLTAEDEHKAWMNSPTHRKNILNSDYREIGVAVGAGEINGETSIIAVQEFGSLAASSYGANDSHNFSSQETDLIKENGIISPQVLAMKESNLDNSKGNANLINLVSVFSTLIFFVSLALAPMAFMAVAFERIMILRSSSVASTAVE